MGLGRGTWPVDASQEGLGQAGRGERVGVRQDVWPGISVFSDQLEVFAKLTENGVGRKLNLWSARENGIAAARHQGDPAGMVQEEPLQARAPVSTSDRMPAKLRVRLAKAW